MFLQRILRYFIFLQARFFKDYYVPKLYKITLPIWGGIKGYILYLLKESIWMIGTHSKPQFWTNNWLGYPLINLVSDGVSLEPPIHALVKDFVDHNVCRLLDVFLPNSLQWRIIYIK